MVSEDLRELTVYSQRALTVPIDPCNFLRTTHYWSLEEIKKVELLRRYR
jgi:hypothetical protein